jgi:hypothetical protein
MNAIGGLDAVSLAGWIVLFVAGTAWELRGILNKRRKGDTLSETVWRFERLAAVVRYLVAGFLLWLVVHFFFGGRFG